MSMESGEEAPWFKCIMISDSDTPNEGRLLMGNGIHRPSSAHLSLDLQLKCGLCRGLLVQNYLPNSSITVLLFV